MEIRQLRYFVSVVENGNLTKAAAKLGIAQPALSVQIRQLERELGMQLLVRHSRGVEPTAEGAELYNLSTDLISRFVNLNQRMKELKQTEPATVVVGMTPSLRNVIGGELVARAAKCKPPVHVTVVEGLSSMLTEWLSMERLDVAVLYDPEEEIRGVRSEPLLSEGLYAFGVPAMFTSGATTISMQEISAFPLVLPALKSEILSRLVFSLARSAGVSLNISAEVQSMATLRDLVLSGQQATILPFGSYVEEIDAGRLRAVKIVDPEISRDMLFSFSDRRNLTRAEWALRQLVRDICAERAVERPDVWQPAGTLRRRREAVAGRDPSAKA